MKAFIIKHYTPLSRMQPFICYICMKKLLSLIHIFCMVTYQRYSGSLHRAGTQTGGTCFRKQIFYKEKQLYIYICLYIYNLFLSVFAYIYKDKYIFVCTYIYIYTCINIYIYIYIGFVIYLHRSVYIH
jgi:hypothetical protein